MLKIVLRGARAFACALTLGALALGAPAAAAAPLFGVSIGNVKAGTKATPSVAALTAFCRAPELIWWNTDQRSWSAYMASLGGQLDPNGNALATLGVPAVVTAPLLVEGATMAQAAAGAYDGYYTQMATAIRARLGAGYNGVFRPANEWNGSWMPWKVKRGEEAQFAAAWRRYVNAVRAVLPAARFEWNVQLIWDDVASGYGGQDLNAAWPGDAYVDFVGADWYYLKLRGHPADSGAFWTWLSSHRLGLTSIKAFAAAHGKPLGFSEWGIDTDAPLVMQNAIAWYAANAAYQIYWMRNDDPGAPTTLMDGSKPNMTALYKAAYCGAPVVTPPVVTPPAGDAVDVTVTIGGVSKSVRVTFP